MALPYRPLMSVEEYLELDRSGEMRYEYIDARVWMLAGGSLDHSSIQANVIGLLKNLLRGGSCHVFTSDARVRLSKTRYVYPDVTVSCNSQDQGRIDTVQFPSLVVEVLSPGTEARDRGLKLSYYRGCPSVQEYVLINSMFLLIEMYRRAKDTLWTYMTFELEDDIELASLGVRFPVVAVYEGVVFPPEDDDIAPA
jgi:Uma2 family endonuclease